MLRKMIILQVLVAVLSQLIMVTVALGGFITLNSAEQQVGAGIGLGHGDMVEGNDRVKRNFDYVAQVYYNII